MYITTWHVSVHQDVKSNGWLQRLLLFLTCYKIVFESCFMLMYNLYMQHAHLFCKQNTSYLLKNKHYKRVTWLKLILILDMKNTENGKHSGIHAFNFCGIHCQKFYLETRFSLFKFTKKLLFFHTSQIQILRTGLCHCHCMKLLNFPVLLTSSPRYMS